MILCYMTLFLLRLANQFQTDIRMRLPEKLLFCGWVWAYKLPVFSKMHQRATFVQMPPPFFFTSKMLLMLPECGISQTSPKTSVVSPTISPTTVCFLTEKQTRYRGQRAEHHIHVAWFSQMLFIKEYYAYFNYLTYLSSIDFIGS